MSLYDVIVIGAGVTGCSAARYLSRYRGRFLVLERGEDVCTGTSKANSAIVHAGFDASRGSKMALYNVRGSRMYPDLAKELDFPYRMNGSLVLLLDESDRPRLEALYENGIANGVDGLRIIGQEELRRLEPHVSSRAVAALWAPTGGITCPFGVTAAFAENAVRNGVTFRFGAEVTAVSRRGEEWIVQTPDGALRTRAVVNAAGLYADVFHNMVSPRKLHITPRRGEYDLLDHEAGGYVTHTVFQLPGRFGKGVLVTPTVHGNLLVGPTAEDIDDREGVGTTAGGLASVAERAALSVDGLPIRETITSFAGLRAHEDGHEFVIGEAPDAPGFLDCAGIESPGLASSPAIGKAVSDMAAERLGLPENPEFDGRRKGITDTKSLSAEEWNRLIREDPAYGRIVCRCESITEGEIREAIRRSPGARSLDGVKRRVRAGMGRCQGGFCSPRVMEILAEELGVPLSEITKSGGASRIIVGKCKDSLA